MIYGVVYAITCLLNGMKYVGQTTRTIKKRFSEHASAKNHLGNAIRKYGRENFKIEVLEECETPEQLNEREIFWIAKLNCKHPNGYNVTGGGESSKGSIEKSLTLMSEIAKKRAETPEGKAQLDKAREIRWEKEKTRPPEERGWISPIRKSIYPVLDVELNQRKIKYSTLANLLKISDKNFSRKMRGKVKFPIEEAEAIKNFLGLEMTIEELFIKENCSDTEKIFSNYKFGRDIYPVLKAELDRKKITAVELAKHLQLSFSIVTRKLSGKVSISLEQKTAIKEFLKIEMSVEELFKRRE